MAELPIDIYQLLLPSLAWPADKVEPLRAVSKNFCGIIDSSPKLRAAKAHYLVLTTAATFSYVDLKRMRGVCKCWKEVIESSPRRDRKLFRQVAVPNPSLKGVALHPIFGSPEIDGHLPLTLVDEGNIFMIGYDEIDITHNPVLQERITCPPVKLVLLKIYDTRQMIKNEAGVTCEQVILDFVSRWPGGEEDPDFFDGFKVKVNHKKGYVLLDCELGS